MGMKVAVISPRILIRRALTALLASTGTAYVVLEANSILENLKEIKRCCPDILIADACGSLEDVSVLAQSGPHYRVLVLMDELRPEACKQAVRMGAWGCLSTRQSPDILAEALRTVAEGRRWTPQATTRRIVETVLEQSATEQKVQEELTPREWEVLGLLANGSRNKDVANRLSISEETVKSHVKAIYRKLNMKDRRNAIFHYFERVHRSSASAAEKSGKSNLAKRLNFGKAHQS